MKKLTKQFIVVYDGDSMIRSLSAENKETFVPNELNSKEFDSEGELDDFVLTSKLIKYEE